MRMAPSGGLAQRIQAAFTGRQDAIDSLSLLCGERPVCCFGDCHDGPRVGEDLDIEPAGIHHGLDRENHPRLELEWLLGGKPWGLVDLQANSMTQTELKQLASQGEGLDPCVPIVMPSMSSALSVSVVIRLLVPAAVIWPPPEATKP